MDAQKLYLTLTPPLVLTVIAASILEILGFMIARRKFDWRAMLTSFGVYIGNVFSELVPIAIALPGAFWLYKHRALEPEKLGVWSWVLLFFVVEFLYYWAHRFGHRVRWFWVSHGVHHTSNDLNILTSYRIGWTHRIMVNYVVYIPAVLLGYDPYAILLMIALVVGFQFWLHTDWIPKLGPLEGILNTPSAHRVHHGGNLEYVDSNYGAVLIIFDRMFGTYQPELDDVPVRYGLVKPIQSYNPFKIAFFQIAPLVKDLWSAKSLREAMGYLFAPPGWRPDGTGTTTEDLRRRAKEAPTQAEAA